MWDCGCESARVQKQKRRQPTSSQSMPSMHLSTMHHSTYRRWRREYLRSLSLKTPGLLSARQKLRNCRRCSKVPVALRACARTRRPPCRCSTLCLRKKVATCSTYSPGRWLTQLASLAHNRCRLTKTPNLPSSRRD